MTIKFYGAISGSKGAPMTGCASSNNFTVSGSGGSYAVTLNEYVATQPVVMAAPVSTSFSSGTLQGVVLVSGWSQPWYSASSPNPAYRFNIKTSDGNGNSTAIDFVFTAVCGEHAVIELGAGDTVTLQPQVIPFGSTPRPILTITFVVSNNGTNRTYHVDSATVIDIVSTDSIEVSLGGISGYTVIAYCSQPPGAEPTQWGSVTDSLSGSPSKSLDVPQGMVSAAYQFIVTATDNESGNVLWADPVIRLSKEAPDGIAPKNV